MQKTFQSMPFFKSDEYAENEDGISEVKREFCSHLNIQQSQRYETYYTMRFAILSLKIYC